MPGVPAVRPDGHGRVQGVLDRAVPGRGGERLPQPQRGAGRRLAGEHRVRRRVDGVLQRDQVRLPVALAGVLPGAQVLVDDLRERRVELVRADLERVAEAAGGVVRPVLGRAGGVVELPRVLAGVAVLGGHLVAERLQRRLVERVAQRDPLARGTRSGAAPFGRSTRLENVWLVISVVTCRPLISSRMFCVSGSENAAAPR